MTRTDTDVMDLLRASDPVQRSSSPDADQLAGVRRIVDHRRNSAPLAPPLPSARSHPAHSTHRRSRVAAIALAAVVATPVGLVALVPGTANRLGLPWLTPAAVIGTELSQRACDGGGHATAIPPAEASPRLWPGELPAGWSVETVFARKLDASRSGCSAPSLVLAETTGGRVGGSVRVVGPLRRMGYPGDPTFTPDRIAGLTAREVAYPGMERSDFQRWVVTGPAGLEWEVDGVGLGEQRAREIADRLSFTPTHVSYAAGADPSVSVLYQRTGPPYPNVTSGGLEWTVRFRDAEGRRREVLVRRSALRLPIGSDEIAPGARIVELDGRPAVEHTTAGGSRGSVTVEVQPGILAWADVRDDLQVVEQLLSSLVQLDKDDPRLTTYALHETYGD
jgi:hypothetical protein